MRVPGQENRRWDGVIDLFPSQEFFWQKLTFRWMFLVPHRHPITERDALACACCTAPLFTAHGGHSTPCLFSYTGNGMNYATQNGRRRTIFKTRLLVSNRKTAQKAKRQDRTFLFPTVWVLPRALFFMQRSIQNWNPPPRVSRHTVHSSITSFSCMNEPS